LRIAPVSLLTILGVTWFLLGGPSAPAQQVQPVDQIDICLQCHDLEAQLAAPVQHSPVASGDCAACHNPHAARHSELLLDRPAILCARCHEDVASALSLPVVHAPASAGRCSDCHQPHGGEHANLLVRSPQELCGECHADVEAWRQQSNRHPPFSQGRCGTCHEPHGARFPNLANNEPGKLCAACHSTTDQFRAAHKGYPVTEADCSQCHDPHASDKAGLLNTETHPPFASGRCTTCHAAPTANEPFSLVDREDRLCGKCHAEQVEANTTAAFPHAAAGGSNCSACHNPHAGEGGAMLKGDVQTTCLGCHDPGGAKSGEEGRFLSHGDNLDCGTCHSPHGGDRPLMLTADSVELCSDCHSHQHAITHPMGETTLDPRNNQPMDCLSCHGIHAAPHDKYLHKDGERDLCVGCHQEKGAVG